MGFGRPGNSRGRSVSLFIVSLKGHVQFLEGLIALLSVAKNIRLHLAMGFDELLKVNGLNLFFILNRILNCPD